MYVEYDLNIESVPNSIAIIPFLCNILPISWVFDLKIFLEEIDENFYNNLEKVKKGYQEMYPSIKMKGQLTVNSIINNYYDAEKSGTFFSGGVDAFDTLLRHIDEKPTLMTVWGADIRTDNFEGWNIVSNHIKKVAIDFQLEHSFIKTNFRTFINYGELCKYIQKFIKGEWWHEFQHGIGLIGLTAPLAYANKFKNVYIASSFTALEKGKVTCASDPTIDNHIHFAGCRTIHDGYEFARQHKIRNIVEWSSNNQKHIPLRVCWQSFSGKNCCECEKCYRTMLGIIAQKKDPNDYGFDFTNEKRKKMMKKVKRIVQYDHLRYSYIQKAFLDNYSQEDTPDDLMWLRNVEFKNQKPIHIKVLNKINQLFFRVKNKLFKIIGKKNKLIFIIKT